MVRSSTWFSSCHEDPDPSGADLQCLLTAFARERCARRAAGGVNAPLSMLTDFMTFASHSDEKLKRRA
jgi:hypothetical protein